MRFVDWCDLRNCYIVAEQNACLVAVLYLCCQNLLQAHFGERGGQQFGRCLSTEHNLIEALVNISNAEADQRERIFDKAGVQLGIFEPREVMLNEMHFDKLGHF